VIILYRPFGNIIQSFNAITKWNMFLQRINMFYMGLNDINMPRTTMFNALRGLSIDLFVISDLERSKCLIENVWYKFFEFWYAERAYCAHSARRAKCCTRPTARAWAVALCVSQL